MIISFTQTAFEDYQNWSKEDDEVLVVSCMYHYK